MSRHRLRHKDGRSRQPTDVTADAWWYEELHGITLFYQQAPTGKVHAIELPFRKLAASLRRIAKARGIRL